MGNTLEPLVGAFLLRKQKKLFNCVGYHTRCAATGFAGRLWKYSSRRDVWDTGAAGRGQYQFCPSGDDMGQLVAGRWHGGLVISPVILTGVSMMKAPASSGNLTAWSADFDYRVDGNRRDDF